jgi:exonuclease III
MGQLILIRRQFSFQVESVFQSDRILTIKVHIDNGELFISNIYAPVVASEKRNFFSSLQKHLDLLDSNDIIVCGDFNCVLDNSKDIVSGDVHPVNDVANFNSLVTDTELNDTWRVFNEDSRIHMVQKIPIYCTKA